MLELLEFRLAGERYGVETRWVREVHPLRDLTPLPCTPSFVLGVVNVRGEILPVLDIKKFFELPEEGITDLHRIIVIAGKNLLFGILADVVVDVRVVPEESLQSSLPTLTGIRGDYLKGIAASELIVLDLEGILSDPQIIVDEYVEI